MPLEGSVLSEGPALSDGPEPAERMAVFALDDVVVYSATDLVTALRCEFAVLRRLDEVLGRAERLEVPNVMRDRAALLGQEHEQLVLGQYRERFGAGVVEIADVEEWTREELLAQQERTLAALASGAAVVAQAGFFDGRFHGRADFLVREDGGGGPRYAVVDTKLSRSAKPTAILQTAAYPDQLQRHGVPLSPVTHLHLGTGVVTSHDVTDTMAVLREHRAHVESLIDTHARGTGAVRWGDPTITACGYCDYCQSEVGPARDVRLVWGLRGSHRAALAEAGITTIDQLAASTGPVPAIRPASLERFRTQARMQLEQEQAEAAGIVPAVRARVHTVEALDLLPEPDAGDVFFDFEGDPMWVDDDRSQWGLEYLFGLRESPTADHPEGRYVAFWAHSRAEEKQALIDFLAYLRQRRADHPRMHVYHYAFYEPAALRALAARHGVGGEEVAALLDAGVFVDLYETVKNSVHVSQRSYSIKKLEPLYMGDVLRDLDGVTDGGASVVAYAEAIALREAGDLVGWHERLEALAEYNAYDCTSTLRLRDWLLQMRRDAHAEALDAVMADAAAALGAHAIEVEDASTGPDPAVVGAVTLPGVPAMREEEVLAERLRSAADLADDPAVPLLVASLRYHRAEDEPFWRAHRERMSAFRADAADTRDVLVVHDASSSAWEQTESGRSRRVLVLDGRLGTGSTIEPGQEVFCVYEPPLPFGMHPRAGQRRAAGYGDVLARTLSPSGEDRLEVRERLSPDVDEHAMAPVLITPGPPPSTAGLVRAIGDVARGVLGEGEPAGGAALDVLRRTPPRQVDGGALPAVAGSRSDAVTRAVLGSDESYVAVQGPPGTGKTTLGATVIARLVNEHGWRVGVVAQSHAVVENMLTQVIAAGVDPQRVAKRGRPAGSDRAWRSLDGTAVTAFLSEEGGRILGGTAWDFSNPARVAPGSLDLLVVDEAGQFALATTVAVSVSARRLLLIGDPQRLPQVSQGRHDQPVDRSALGWLTGAGDVLPPELGYVLDETWRLHPALCAAVSELSYAGTLRSAASAAGRALDGIDPGVHVVQVPHRGNVVDSPEEAAEVLAQVERLLGRDWTDGEITRPLGPADVIVVAAYNAQVQRIRRDLDRAGLAQVRVGTVDRFQGQEAAVVIVSLAASTAADAARGLGFLLSRNRINVAISRGMWAAIIVRSPALTRHMPSDAGELADLGAFIALCAHAHDRRQRHHTSTPVPTLVG